MFYMFYCKAGSVYTTVWHVVYTLHFRDWLITVDYDTISNSFKIFIVSNCDILF